MRELKIGIYGGTFDPPHIGHIAAAKAAMETLALARISAQVYSPNIASRRVLEHNGFQQEGLLPQAVWKDGMTYDLILYGILRDPGKKD